MEKLFKIWYNSRETGNEQEIKRNSKGMKKNRKRFFLIVTEGILLLLLLLSIIFPSSVMSAIGGNTDTADINLLNSITDRRQIELFVTNVEKNVEGIMLYFKITGEASEGKIICDIYGNGEEPYATEEISLNELGLKESGEEIRGNRIIFSSKTKHKDIEGNMRIVLRGEDIPLNTQVSLYGNHEENTSIRALSKGMFYNSFPLYQFLIQKKEYRYTWDCLLLFIFFNAVFFLKKENHG